MTTTAEDLETVQGYLFDYDSEPLEALTRIRETLAHLERGAELLRAYIGQDAQAGYFVTPDRQAWIDAETARKGLR